MKVLLDTHVWLWMLTDPDRIPAEIRAVLGDGELLVSSASTWEIAIKHALGKLPLPESPVTFVPARLRTTGCRSLPITVEESLVAGALPQLHRDPFDRLLIAQSQVLGVPLCSADRVFTGYDVELLWS